MTFAGKAIKYFSNLKTPKLFHKEVGIINPYEAAEVKDVVKKFYKKYFNDNNKRVFVFGINPGRFGGGLTGISFTDPIALREECGIETDFGTKKELSSKFIYRMIQEFGGVKRFYSNVFLSALLPFALIKNGKNYNYYDSSELADDLKDEIIKSIKAQVVFGAIRDSVIILGKKNAEYFFVLNDEHNFFKQVIVLEHPRYIMQYKLRKIDHYISKYLKALGN